LFRDVDDEARPDELVERYLVGRLAAFGEMNGSIDVGASMRSAGEKS
jgi:hypothetical protein